jgi:drug/metabolite transporter (DMT)-like permease
VVPLRVWRVALAGSGYSADYVLGLLMCAGGSLSYAAVTLLAKTERSVSPFALAWWQCVVGVLVLAWVPFIQGWPTSGSAWAWLAGLGVIHTGLAYAVIFAGMARLTAGNIAVLQFVYPVTAVLVDWAVYGRTLNRSQLLGVTLMALSLWVIRAPARQSQQ